MPATRMRKTASATRMVPMKPTARMPIKPTRVTDRTRNSWSVAGGQSATGGGRSAGSDGSAADWRRLPGPSLLALCFNRVHVCPQDSGSSTSTAAACSRARCRGSTLFRCATPAFLTTRFPLADGQMEIGTAFARSIQEIDDRWKTAQGISAAGLASDTGALAAGLELLRGK